MLGEEDVGKTGCCGSGHVDFPHPPKDPTVGHVWQRFGPSKPGPFRVLDP